jgi:hypothetical protein
MRLAHGVAELGRMTAFRREIRPVNGKVADLDVVELGCRYRALLRLVGQARSPADRVDLTAAQLATARRCQERSVIFFPLIEADADQPVRRGEKERTDLAIEITFGYAGIT